MKTTTATQRANLISTLITEDLHEGIKAVTSKSLEQYYTTFTNGHSIDQLLTNYLGYKDVTPNKSGMLFNFNNIQIHSEETGCIIRTIYLKDGILLVVEMCADWAAGVIVRLPNNSEFELIENYTKQ